MLPNDRSRYFLNAFNVNAKAEFSDIRAAFNNDNIVKIYPVGVTRKIYDLEFATKAQVMEAAEKAPTMIMGQPVYVRMSLKNTTQYKPDYNERNRWDNNERPGRGRGGEARKDSGYYGDRDEKYDKKPRHYDYDDEVEYVQKAGNPSDKGYKDTQTEAKPASKGYQESQGDRNYKGYDKERDRKPDRSGYKKKPETAKHDYKDEHADKHESIKPSSKQRNHTNAHSNKTEVQKNTKQEGQYANKNSSNYKAKGNSSAKYQDKPQQPYKEQTAKLTMPDPQTVLNAQRVTKPKGKTTYATANMFELFDTSD